MSSTVAFSGTYTQNQGEAAAAGTVTITPYGQSATVATLDSAGRYSASIPFAGQFSVVEALTGVPSRTFRVSGIDGAVIDTSRDIGTVQGGSSGSIGSISGLSAALAAKQDTIPSGTYVPYLTTLTGVAIQAALDARAAAGGGDVDLKPRATYVTLLPVYVPSNVTLKLNGATIQADPAAVLDYGTTSAVVIMQGTTDVAVLGPGTVDVNGLTRGIMSACDLTNTLVATRHTVRGVRIINGTSNALRQVSPYIDLTWDDNVIEDCGKGLLALADTGIPGKGLRITRNRLRRVGLNSIQVYCAVASGHVDVLVADNDLRDFTTPTTAIPIEVTGSDRVMIRGNNIATAATRGVSTGACNDLTVTANRMMDQTTYAVEMGGSKRVSITGNTARGCKSLVQETLNASEDVLIDGNIYSGSGLTVDAATAAVMLPNTAKRVRITNNIFTDWVHLTQGCVRLGSNTAVEDVVVEGNTFVATDANTPLLAVQVRKGVRCSVVRNAFRVERDLVAGDDYSSPIQPTIDAASSSLLIEANDIIFTGAVAAATNAAGINNGNVAAGALPGLVIRRNKVTGGPRGIRLLVNSTDLIVDGNDTATCAAANVVPATVSLNASDTADPFGWGLVMNEIALGGGALGARVWDTANRCYYWRLIGAVTITKIGVKVGVSSGNICLAVYRNSGVGRSAAPTGGQLATTGAIACPTAGIDTNVPLTTFAVGSSAVLQAGDWIAMSCDNTTASFTGIGVGITVSALYSGRGGYQSSAHPCPSTPALTGIGLPGAAALVGVP